MTRLTRRAHTIRFGAGTAALLALLLAVDSGHSTEPTRNVLLFAGSLDHAGNSPSLDFVFSAGGTAQCTVTVTPTLAADGQFAVEVPLASCPADLFDGQDVSYAVKLGTTVLQQGNVDPVPYAKYADHSGVGDCPVGYARVTSSTGFVDCHKGQDEVVKVGQGAGAFWIDRFEAGVFDDTGRQYGATSNDYPAGFPANGQLTTFLHAESRAGITPSANLTWFQAAAACRASGKRLATQSEWLLAASGTPDPGSNAGTSGACVTNAIGLRMTGFGTGCRSVWGAEDMIGNAAEYTAGWFSGVGDGSTTATPWGSAYNDDATANIASSAITTGTTAQLGMPSAAVRGGDISSGDGAGRLALSLVDAPVFTSPHTGFRCVITP